MMKKIIMLILLIGVVVPFNSYAREFAGINFGVAISLTHDLGENKRVSSAIVDDNGIVRVEKQSNDVARVMLESHYFFEKNEGHKFLGLTEAEKWGHGPFIALQPGTDEIIEAIGFGWMFGFRKDAQATASWNLGVGLVIDPSVKILGDGIEENKSLPTGETQIRYKETSQAGLLILFSFTF